MIEKTRSSLSVTSTEISIGTSIVVTMLLCHLLSFLSVNIQTLAACTAAVMCTQDAHKASWGAGLNRVLGVICGGVLGVIIVLLDNWIDNKCVFFLLCGFGIVGNLFLCKVVKLPAVQGRVSCMSLLLVVLVVQGEGRINYAVGRFIGTVFGAVAAWLVSALWSTIIKKQQK